MEQLTTYDSRISIAKAICIILMVVLHSSISLDVSRAVGLFHMPCFFFVSGFLLKDKYIDAPFKFLKQRMKTLWWPFVKFTCIFILFHNLFCALHLYGDSGSWGVVCPYTIKQMGYKALSALAMRESEQLLGGFWFIRELFYAAVVVVMSLAFLKRIKTRSGINNKTGG